MSGMVMNLDRGEYEFLMQDETSKITFFPTENSGVCFNIKSKDPYCSYLLDEDSTDPFIMQAFFQTYNNIFESDDCLYLLSSDGSDKNLPNMFRISKCDNGLKLNFINNTQKENFDFTINLIDNKQITKELFCLLLNLGRSCERNAQLTFDTMNYVERKLVKSNN